jgi:hypothetical protein
MVKAVGNNGFVGGPAKQLWRAAFGPSQEADSNTRNNAEWQNTSRRPSFETIGPGTYEITMGPEEESSWKKIADGMEWNLSPTKNSDWDFIPFNGEVRTYRKDQNRYTTSANQDMIFKIKTRETTTFVLKVSPKV